jgi:hypothetical protein
LDVVKQLTTLGGLHDWYPTDANAHYDQYPDSEEGMTRWKYRLIEEGKYISNWDKVR